MLLAMTVALVALGFAPSRAEAATESVAYVDAQGNPMGPEECDIITAQTPELKSGWYAVKGNVEISKRLSFASGSTTNLILCDGATLTLPKGLDVYYGISLRIYGQENGSGKLVARNGGDGFDAAIGSSWSRQQNSGSIVIRGGKVEASSNNVGAAIGGSYIGMANVTIEGGEVTATATGRGAAIGSGAAKGNAYINIRGGKVNATSTNSQSCAIGGTVKDSILTRYYTYVTITGGEVNATSSGIAAIGSGNGTAGGTVTISGGTVNATASGAAAIGCPGVMKTLLTHEEGNPITRVTSSGYAGSLTLGVLFYDGSGILQPGDITNEQAAGKTLISHTAHEPGAYHAPADPTYDAATGKYINGNTAYYDCAFCDAHLVKEGNSYREAQPTEYLIPYFEYEWHNAYVVMAYNGKDADIVIPDKIPDDYPDESLRGRHVESIVSDTFRGNKTLRSVKAVYLDKIGEEAFRGCSNLEEAIFGQNLFSIGDEGFYDCPKLERLEIRRDGPIWFGSLRPWDAISDVCGYGCPKVVVYGYHDSIVHDKTNWGIRFVGIDTHDVTATWKWGSPNPDTGLYEGTAVFTCKECSLHEEVKASLTSTAQATCTQASTAKYSASFTDNVGKTWPAQETKAGTALGHEPKDDFVKENITNATCDTTGTYDRVTYCKRCNAELQRETVKTPALGHDWDEGTITTEPTCTTKGVKTFTCKNDGSHTRTEDIDALGHVWGEWTVTANPTETAHGQESRSCSRCDQTETRSIPARQHEHHVSRKDAHDSTCAAQGNIEYYVCDQNTDGSVPCNRCFVADEQGTITIHNGTEEIQAKEVNLEDTLLPLADHSWDGGVVTKPAACVVDGVKTYTCTACGATKEEVIEKTLHDTEDVKVTIREATCDHSGYHWNVRRCKVCQASLSMQLARDAMLGHKWGEWETKTPATATAEGEETRTCKNDSAHVETRAIPKVHVHQLTHVGAKPATCTEPGYPEHYICDEGDSPCLKVFSDAGATNELNRNEALIPATDHSWGAWKVTKKPTCTEEGEETRTCTSCGETETQAVEAAHDLEDVTELVWAPMCAAPGYHFENQRCKVCGEVVSGALVEDDPLGHDWGPWTVVKEATETEEGEETRTCARCDETETRAIPVVDPQKVSYRATAGDGVTWVKGSGVSADFTFKRSVNDGTTFDHFTGISIDSVAVDASAYTAERGSVVVKLKPAYLETLPLGPHTLTAQFDDGSTTARLVIAAQDGTVKPDGTIKPDTPGSGANGSGSSGSSSARQTLPKTDDGSLGAPWLALGTLAGMLLVAVGLRQKRSRAAGDHRA